MTMTSIEAYHGGELEGASWYTTDADHAACFGPVQKVVVASTVEPARLVAEDVVGDLFGYEADAALWAHLEAIEAAWALVEGWEPGLCIIVREPGYVHVSLIGDCTKNQNSDE